MIYVISCDVVNGGFLFSSYCTSASKSRSPLKSLESLQSSSSVFLASTSVHILVITASLDFSQLWFSPSLLICCLISYGRKKKFSPSKRNINDSTHYISSEIINKNILFLLLSWNTRNVVFESLIWLCSNQWLYFLLSSLFRATSYKVIEEYILFTN